MRTIRKAVPILALTLVTFAGCSDSPTPSSPTDTGAGSVRSFSSIARQPRNVPTVAIDRPVRPRPWDTDDSALVAAVAAAGGRAVIGIKEPESERALATGLRRAVRASGVQAGLELLRTNRVEVLELLDAIGAASVRIDPALAPVLRAHPLVDYVEPDQQMELATAGSRTAVATTAALAQTTPWGIQMVRAPQAWTITRGAGVKIQLIDTGHEQHHPDLPAVSGANCAGSFGGCDDAGVFNHGTHVLGIWTTRDNTLGVVGVAPAIAASDVYVYGACSSTSASCSSTEVTAGINAAIFNAKVINLSLSGPFNTAQANAVAQAWANDIVIVAAAGNNQTNVVVYPAGHPNVIGVSGVNQNKSFAASGTVPSWCPGYSNQGSHVDLSAPFSAFSSIPGGTYGDKCGTSMSTPHVAGAAALVRARNPSWTNQQVVSRLLTTAEDRGPAGRDNQFGHGIVDAAKAVGFVEPFVVTASAPEFVSVKKTYQLTGSASHPASGWKWERSDGGGATWRVWGTTQNSAFSVAAGEDYTIQWRLFARRNSDAVTAFGFASTVVCTVIGGCDGGPIP